MNHCIDGANHYFKVGLAVMLIGSLSLLARAADEPGEAELIAWEAALSAGEPHQFERFLDQYPDSMFASEAQQLLASISPSEEQGVTRTETETAQVLSLYEQPVAGDTFADSPRSIRELAEGSPLFPPMEGLPEAYWKEEVCSNCHGWARENLCEQGNFFASRDQSAIDRIAHPYGGFFKEAIKVWAANGCD